MFIAWFNPKIDVMDDLRDYFRDEFLKEIVQAPGVVGAILAENNLEVVIRVVKRKALKFQKMKHPLGL